MCISLLASNMKFSTFSTRKKWNFGRIVAYIKRECIIIFICIRGFFFSLQLLLNLKFHQHYAVVLFRYAHYIIEIFILRISFSRRHMLCFHTQRCSFPSVFHPKIILQLFLYWSSWIFNQWESVFFKFH